MPEDTNAVSFAKNLLGAGCDVRFYDDLTQHPEVQKVIGKSTEKEEHTASNNATSGFSFNPLTYAEANTCFMTLFGTPLKLDPLETACRMCGAMVPITRHSHLANHVTKHCLLKKFQCTECDFASTGKVKVISHMKQRHSVVNKPPFSKSQHEIQQEINALLEHCFPDYNQKLDMLRERITNTVVIQPEQAATHSTYLCAECHSRVTTVDGKELAPESLLISHLRLHHTLQCMPWRCGECHWKSSYEWKVRRHICVRHTERASLIEAVKEKTPDWKMFLHKYFLDLPEALQGKTSRDEKADEELDMNRVFWDNVVEARKLKYQLTS